MWLQDEVRTNGIEGKGYIKFLTHLFQGLISGLTSWLSLAPAVNGGIQAFLD